MKKNLYYLIVLIILGCPKLKSQYAEGFEYEGGVLYNKVLENPMSYQLSAKYNYYFNRHIGFSLGGMMLYSNINERFKSPAEPDFIYIMDNNIFKLNGIIGLKLGTPLFKNIGFSSDINFIFEPIPIDWLSYKKTKPLGSAEDDSSKTKFIFTCFNPSILLQGGFYYDVKDKSYNSKLRICIGGGVGYYNPYITYYRGSINSIKLRNHLTLKPKNITYDFYMKFSSIQF